MGKWRGRGGKERKGKGDGERKGNEKEVNGKRRGGEEKGTKEEEGKGKGEMKKTGRNFVQL